MSCCETLAMGFMGMLGPMLDVDRLLEQLFLE